MNEKYKKICTTLNYTEYFLILSSTVTGCSPVSVFISLIVITIGILSYAIGLKICAKTTEITKYNSMIRKNKKKNDKLVLLAKSELNNIEVLTSKAFVDSVISYDEFVLINNVLKEYDEMKGETETLNS